MPTVSWNRPLSSARRVAASLVTGFGIAAVVHLAILLVFFTVNGASSANIVPISDYFLPATLTLFVLASLAVVLGALRTWYFALLAGLVAGILAAFAGTAYGIVSKGTAWNADVFAAVLGTLVGTNLIYIIATVLVAVLLGPAIWAVAARRSSSAQPIVLVRQPSTRLAEGQVTHVERIAIDPVLADEQWDAYVEVFEKRGFEVVEVPAAETHPDSVFVEDTIVILGSTAVIASPGAESRRGETDGVRATAKSLGLKIREIELPGTLDGGDVLQVGSTVYVGRSGRTNAEGVRQLRGIATDLGLTVVAVPVSKTLHLKSAVTALPDGTVVGFAKAVDVTAFERFLALPEAGAAVVVLSADTVLMASSTPKSTKLIEDLGYTVVTVDVSEFEKLEGCVTCLSVRIPA